MSSQTERPEGKGPLERGAEGVRRFREALLAFFGSSARDLPWRAGPDEAPDPYRILVSEVMLQQTRVDTVIPYFHRWMERFPTAEALARADPDEVLSVWQGLGYYSRARNLQGAVREVVERYEGTVPSDPATLEELPGIGPYTAGAVASIAFGVSAPAVDGNVRRVLARLMDEPEPPPATLRRWAAALVDPERPGAFNQALMELGSLVCTPKAPDCDTCPVSEFCAARTAGTQEARPAPRARRAIPVFHEVVAVLMRHDGEGARVLLRRRPSEGLLGGMWELPGQTVEKGEESSGRARSVAEEALRSLGEGGRGLDLDGEPEPLSPLDHAFSHRKVRYLPFRFPVRSESDPGPHAPDREALRWIRPSDPGGLPIPAGQRKLLSRLEG